MKYPMKSKTERPLFEFMVKYLNNEDYYLFDNFNDALRKAEVMSPGGNYHTVIIYEVYFDTTRREFYAMHNFSVCNGIVEYEKAYKNDLHLYFYLNCGEWLNPNKEWIKLLNS